MTEVERLARFVPPRSWDDLAEAARSQIVQLEWLRARIWGFDDTRSRIPAYWGSHGDEEA
jgi:hypothetical protein